LRSLTALLVIVMSIIITNAAVTLAVAVAATKTFLPTDYGHFQCLTVQFCSKVVKFTNDAKYLVILDVYRGANRHQSERPNY